MSVIGGQNPVVQDGLVYILDFGNIRSYTSGSNSAKSLIYNPVTASFVAPPAGDYSGLAAAYSVRRVVSSYTGSAMEVQSGSVSASIGFDSFGNLDTGSLLAFAGSGDAFVKTWYDQSGNGRHASQISSSRQPKIYSGSQGSVIVNNGKPAVQFDGINDYLSSTSFAANPQPLTLFLVSRWISLNSFPYLVDLGGDRALGYISGVGNKNEMYYGALLTSTKSVNFTDNLLWYAMANGASSELSINNESLIVGNAGTGNASSVTIGTATNLNTGAFSNANYCEFLFYNNNQSTNRLSIESNINSYYNIYTSSFSPTPGFDTNKIDLSRTVAVDTNRTFPGFSYNQGNLTLIFTGETKTNTPLFTQANQMSVVGTTSSISYGLPNNTIGRTFPASGFDHISLRFTTGSVDCFVNGIPTGPNSIFPTGSFGTGDFIASNYSGSLGNLMVYNRPLTDDEIYSIYLQQARRYSLPETPKPYTVDSSVYVYSQAAGITDTVTLNALNTFVQGLKSASLWDKMVAIYPFIGVNSSGSRLNLKDVSLNTTQVNYSGSWSTSLSGSRNNNTASYGILSNVRGTYVHPLINSQSIHLSYLSYDTPASGGYLMGVEQIPGLPGDIAQPAAAYSVRKVRTAYTGSAMTVRRDFDDLTFDVGFDGNGNLDTGSLLRNMTASLNTPTLPGDYSGLAAAYSLRRVSSSYSGYAVEVRRAVDNYSASIGFDGSGNLNTASLASFIRTGSETPISAYSGLAAAYSLRKVVPGYAGAAIEIQSGSVSQSIGFDSFGDLDITAIRTFAGSGNAFVKTWFDQSGNNKHAIQYSVVNQPQIVSSGILLTSSNYSAINFNGTSMFLTSSNTNFSLVERSTFTVFQMNTQKNDGRIWSIWNDSGNDFSQTSGYEFQQGNSGRNDEFGMFGSTSTSYFLSTGSRSTVTSQSIVSEVLSGTTGSLYKNSTLVAQDTSFTAFDSAPTNNFYIGLGFGGFYGDIRIQEILIYTSSQAANRTYIENNINSYYGIYTPSSVSTENAFVKTWYDQSGNNNHAIQTLTESQPQIVNNGLIITQSGKPALDFIAPDYLEIPSFNTNVTTTYSYFDVNTFSAFSADYSQLFGGPYGGTATIYYLNFTGPNGFGVYTSGPYFNSSSVALNTQTLMTLITSGSTNFNTYYNSSFRGSVSPNTTNLDLLGKTVRISANPTLSTEFFVGKRQEIILYSSSLSSSRSLIEDNINGYYNIFTQSLASGSGYVTRWYDQSGNNNHATQSVAANQPLILSSGSIITDNGKPSLNFNGKILTSSFPYTNGVRYTSFQAIKQLAGAILGATTNTGGAFYAVSDTLGSNSFSGFSTVSYFKNGNPISGVLRSSLYNVLLNEEVILTSFITNTSTANLTIGYPGYSNYNLKEKIVYSSDQSSSRQPIEQNINNYFNIYSQPFNLNTNSLSLFSSPTTVVGAANNVASASFTTGGPLGLITVSRTGSSNYTLWKNRVPNKVTLSPSTASSSEIYLNAANVNNALFSGSQNNIAYASVGAGLTDNELYTYYELVDDLQTSLNRGVQDPNAFITTWDTRITGTGTISNTSSIVLPLYGTQAITASWGDGTTSLISQSTQVERTHSYATPGVYTVSITGQGQGFQFNNGGDRAKLIDVGQWGSISGSTTAVFNGCFNLIGTAPDPHVLQTTSMNDYFLNDPKFNGYVNNWDVSRVTSFTQTFAYTLTSFNQPLDNWDTSTATSMAIMFAGANKFNQNIGSWNTGNVTNPFAMFSNASAFNNGGSPSINNWNTGKFTTTYQMFSGAARFNQPIGSWNTSNVTNMAYMLEYTSQFNQNIGAWNVEKVTTMFEMLLNSTTFNNSGSNSINNWRPISCSSFGGMFQNALAFNQPIGNWTIGTGSQIPSIGINMTNMFKNADAFNQNLGAWNVEKVTNMSSMFQDNGGFNNSGSSDINNWRPISCSNFSSMFSSATAFNQPVGGWIIGTGSHIPIEGINMTNMFASANNFNQNIGSWDVSAVTNMERMFQTNTAFNNAGSSDINNWNVSRVTNFLAMFDAASSFNQPLGNWNTISASRMDYMFKASPFNQPIGNWNVSNVILMDYMFENNSAFNQDIGSWNVSKVTSFTNFMAGKTAANYSYLHTIYDGWIQNRLQPQRTISFGSINYSASAAEGKALLERPYVTQSINNIQDSASFINIVTLAPHNLTPNNKVFIFGVSGSISGSVNGLRTVLSTGSATEFTLSGSLWNPSQTYDVNTGTVITGYGWNITDGNPV